jgi:3'-5' exoribonuclease
MTGKLSTHKGTWIADLRDGDAFVGFYAISNLRLEPFRDPSRGRFLRMVLSDRTGCLEARVWEDGEKVAASLDAPQAVKVEGQIETFQSSLQARISRIRPASDGEFDLTDLRPGTRREVDGMLSEIDRAVGAIRDPFLSALCSHFFNDPEVRSALRTASAAKRIHHSYVGGLLEHIYEVLLLSRPLIELYPQLDGELLTAGILLHDLGKLEELTFGLTTEYTDIGRLLGHVVLSTQKVEAAIERIPGFPSDLAVRLVHMLLSHHGRYEWGSPRRPKTLEAAALHHLENLDGQVNRFAGMLDSARQVGQAWTDYEPELGRTLYAGHEEGLTPEERSLLE